LQIKSNKEKGKYRVWNAKSVKERVTQSPSTPSTKAIMEVISYIVLPVNDPMPRSKPHD
jgi:hypothetical protein